MTTDNLTDLIELLTNIEETEPDIRLKEGQVFSPTGEIITL